MLLTGLGGGVKKPCVVRIMCDTNTLFGENEQYYIIVGVKGKVMKFTLQQATKTHRGVEVYLQSFFNFGARSVWVVNAAPWPLYPLERPDTHCIGGWVGPRAGLDGCGKSRPPSGFDPRTLQPVTSRYTD